MSFISWYLVYLTFLLLALYSLSICWNYSFFIELKSVFSVYVLSGTIFMPIHDHVVYTRASIHRLIDIEISIISLKASSDSRKFIMVIPILVKGHLFSKWRPWDYRVLLILNIHNSCFFTIGYILYFLYYFPIINFVCVMCLLFNTLVSNYLVDTISIIYVFIWWVDLCRNDLSLILTSIFCCSLVVHKWLLNDINYH